jgi:hypothetical protein
LEIEEKTVGRGREKADRLESETMQADIPNEAYYHEIRTDFFLGAGKESITMNGVARPTSLRVDNFSKSADIIMPFARNLSLLSFQILWVHLREPRLAKVRRNRAEMIKRVEAQIKQLKPITQLQIRLFPLAMPVTHKHDVKSQSKNHSNSYREQQARRRNDRARANHES